jgi:hypothetical protein
LPSPRAARFCDILANYDGVSVTPVTLDLSALSGQRFSRLPERMGELLEERSALMLHERAREQLRLIGRQFKNLSVPQALRLFALRVFDATGMEFLSNYIGEAYAGVLSTLDDRHAVVFGRASSCRDAVLIRLNERADFLRVFRNAPAGTSGALNQ